MCGIAGVYWFGSDRPCEAALWDMLNAAVASLSRRGPDERSTISVSQGCLLGGTRLIVRGSMGCGSMPFKANGHVLFYNGEVFDHSSWGKVCYSDGELLIPLIERFGLAAFEKIDAEFALSYWQENSKTITLVRDVFGTKPLFFSLNDKRLLWGSTERAILEMEFHPLCSIMTGPLYEKTLTIQEPYTSYSGIWSVPPGHALIVNPTNVQLIRYHSCKIEAPHSTDLSELSSELDNILETRLDYTGTIGIPLSGGIDSGIIAFSAERLGIPYETFSVVSMFGDETGETRAIFERVSRLKHVKRVHLISVGDSEYTAALSDIFSPGYYDSARFDTGVIGTHTVYSAMKTAGIKVALDGSGGDELFHGYTFRERFKPVDEWPLTCTHNKYFYSLYTTLLAFTSKTDRAGGFHSIESRFPFQSRRLLEIAQRLKPSSVLKWPLRKYLTERLNYGSHTYMDANKKQGFSIRNRSQQQTVCELEATWCRARNIWSLPSEPPRPFPFLISA